MERSRSNLGKVVNVTIQGRVDQFTSFLGWDNNFKTHSTKSREGIIDSASPRQDCTVFFTTFDCADASPSIGEVARAISVNVKFVSEVRPDFDALVLVIASKVCSTKHRYAFRCRNESLGDLCELCSLNKVKMYVNVNVRKRILTYGCKCTVDAS